MIGHTIQSWQSATHSVVQIYDFQNLYPFLKPALPIAAASPLTFTSRMRHRKTIFLALLGALSLYLISYIGISLCGHYEPTAYGLIQGPNDTAILAPKSAFGYQWNPFGTDTMDPDADHEGIEKLSRVYAPLIFIDLKIWHTKKGVDQAGSGDYRVKHFFDQVTKSYRDIEPN